jgi:hypothetical protein
MEARLTRRVLGVLVARLPETRLDKLDDPRSLRGRRWPLAVLLRAVLVALVAGCKSLAQAEALTAEMSAAARKRLGIARRIADTTMRDLLCMLDPDELRRSLHAVVRAAASRTTATTRSTPPSRRTTGPGSRAAPAACSPSRSSGDSPTTC